MASLFSRLLLAVYAGAQGVCMLLISNGLVNRNDLLVSRLQLGLFVLLAIALILFFVPDRGYKQK